MTIDQAVEALRGAYASSIDDPDEGPVFWLATAHAAWTLGRPHAEATREALQVIESGRDLTRWDSEKDRKKRERVLATVAEELGSTPPPAKRIPRRKVASSDWVVGEVIGFQLARGPWTVMRVIGHHEDRGGRFAVLELLDFIGDDVPDAATIEKLELWPLAPPWNELQVMLVLPYQKAHKARLRRTGVLTTPSRLPGRYMPVGFPEIDRVLAERFGIV